MPPYLFLVPQKCQCMWRVTGRVACCSLKRREQHVENFWTIGRSAISPYPSGKPRMRKKCRKIHRNRDLHGAVLNFVTLIYSSISIPSGVFHSLQSVHTVTSASSPTERANLCQRRISFSPKETYFLQKPSHVTRKTTYGKILKQ